MFSTRLFAPTLLGFSALTLLFGCTGVSPVAPISPSSLTAKGVVHGGQQPVANASIGLYSVGTTGDGSAVSLLGQAATGNDGSFSLTGTYNCLNAPNGVNSLVYVLSFGGNPGSGSNPNLVLMAALGPCGSLTLNTFINIDEVTTVGSIAALYSPYMTSALNLGSGLGDAGTFATAFGKVAQYTNTSSGTAPGPSLPGGMYASSTEIDTLSNIVASCVNSTGGVASDTTTACGNLFNLTRSSGGVAPTDTIQAIINILNNPTQNASALFSLPQPNAPFQPSLSTAPTTWALPILPIAATPSISVLGGSYSSAQFVTLSDTSTGAIIHYTTDGTTPTSTSPTYSGTITVSSSETLNAIALGGGFASSTVASAAYTITGSTQTYSVNGQFNLTTGCGGGFIPPITLTLTNGSTVVQTIASNTSGNFTFTNVPNGNYTVTPSITGPASLFYPASQSAIVAGNNLNLSSLSAALGYNVSGTVAYTGSQAGQTYLVLNPTATCGSSGTEGTSISTKGAFTIHGVPPGSYTLQAFMDNVGNGTANASNPSGSISTAVSTSNLTSQNVTLADPTAVTVATAPTITGASGFNTGAVVQYQAITNGSVEQPSTYTVQWSTSPTFATTTGSSQPFRANGTKASVWFLHGLADTSIYYFRAYGSSAGTAVGPFSNIYGPVTIGAPAGANTVSGAVSFSPAPGGPLYVGFLGQTTGNFYVQYIASPASAQAYTIQVPSDSYNYFAILDQNHDGLIDAGDIQDATENGNGPGATTVISGNTSNLNLTLPSASANATLTTQFNNSINPGNNFQAYYLNFQVNGLVKQPVAVTLTSGPNLINPVDIAVCGGPGSGCNRGFQIYFGIGATVPSVGDTYAFNVTYSDGTSGILTATITAVLNALPTSLAPQTGTSASLTPTFTWADPSNPSNYTYQFSICCSGSNTIWQIPGQSSNGNGFPSTITSITWGIDPTGGGSSPSIGNLVLGTNYSWSIQVQDANGNSAQTQVQYQP